MTTKQVEPDTDRWRDQERRQRTRVRNRKVGAIGVAAAIGVVAAVLILANRPGDGGTETVPPDESSLTTAPGATAPVGTVFFNGSTCELRIEATFEPGLVVFEVVNATDRPAQFDAWELIAPYSFPSFQAQLERGLRRLDAGKEGTFPEIGQQVLYLDNESLPAHGSGIASFTLVPGREYAITCLRDVPGQGVYSWGPAGPITAG